MILISDYHKKRTSRLRLNQDLVKNKIQENFCVLLSNLRLNKKRFYNKYCGKQKNKLLVPTFITEPDRALKYILASPTYNAEKRK